MLRNPRVVRFLQAGASTLALLVIWQIASLFFPNFLFPSISEIVKRTLDIFLSVPLLLEVLATAARIP